MTASESSVAVERYERARERDHRRTILHDIEQFSPSVTAKVIDEVVSKKYGLLLRKKSVLQCSTLSQGRLLAITVNVPAELNH